MSVNVILGPAGESNYRNGPKMLVL